MADIQAPTTTIEGQQSIVATDYANRALNEQKLLVLMAQQMNALDPSRGYEIR